LNLKLLNLVHENWKPLWYFDIGTEIAWQNSFYENTYDKVTSYDHEPMNGDNNHITKILAESLELPSKR
jgi:hypothetical protein